MIFSFFAFGALFISMGIKDRKKSLLVQSINCLFEAMYDFLISAYTGAFLSIINFVRSFLFLYKEKYSKRRYLFFLFFFWGIILCNCFLTWEGFLSFLPTIASMIRVYCLWQEDMKLVRISGVTTSILYGLYFYSYHSLSFVYGYFILFLVSITSIYLHDIQKQDKIINTEY